MNWTDVKTEILSKLNIESEYAALGIKFTSNKPTPKGWLSCHAEGREDKDASAGVNVGDGSSRGYYNDFGGTGDSLSLFDFAVQYGQCKDFRDSIVEYGKKAGFNLSRLPKGDYERPEDAFRFLPDFNTRLCRGLVKKNEGVSIESILLCGGRIAKYPRAAAEPQYCVSFGVYGPQLADLPPRGYVAMACDGGPMKIWRGKDSPPEEIKKLTKGDSGLVGRHGVQYLEQSEMVYKVEGITDLLALQDFIPEEYIDKHVVVTNAGGAREHAVPFEVAPAFAGLKVILIHDADEPGQEGIKNWVGALANGVADCVKNVQLPYEIEEKSGKDLRDWINEGNTYEDLLSLVKETNPVEPSSGQSDSTGVNTHQAILNRLGVIVLGHIADSDVIVAHSSRLRRTFHIRSIDRYSLPSAILHMGEEIDDEIDTGSDPDRSKLTMSQVRKALAAEAGKQRLTDSNQLGVGIWELNGRVILVGAGEIAIWNGKLSMSRVPAIEGKLIDFGGSDPWFDYDRLKHLFEKSSDPGWCKDVLEESMEIFSRWDNWIHPDSPELVTALVCCSWIQTIWHWRPQIAITGPTNSGKTMLMEETIQQIFGELSFFSADATEPGLRQILGHTSKIILIDEFEHSDNRQKVLKLFRMSSRGGEIVRGTGNQRGLKFQIRHIPWVGAIETGMRHAADRNRYVMLELRSVPKDQGSKLKIPPQAELRDLGQRLMVVAVRHQEAAVKLAAALKSNPHPHVDRRVVESYSVPVAMLATVMGLNQDESEALLMNVLSRRDFSIQQEGDEENLLTAIYESIVRMSKGEMVTVSQLLNASSQDHDELPDNALERIGIRRVYKNHLGEDAKCLFFSKEQVRTELLRNRDQSEKEIDQILIRIPGAFRDRQRMGSHNPRGISIPESSISDILGEAEVF